MSCEIINGAAVALADAGRGIPGKPSPSTVYRWCVRGVDRGDGRRVKLRSWRVGRKRFTTEAAITEFVEALNSSDTTEASDSDHERQRERLSAAGLL